MKTTIQKNTELWNSNNLLIEWVKKNDYVGWDTYDALNSDVIKKICAGNPVLKVLCTQVNIYSPINFRPILKIKKGKDTKGLALFTQAYANLYNLTNNTTFKNELEKCVSFLEKKSLKEKYNFHCWSSHYFPYTFNDKIIHTPDTPDIIGTSQTIIALVVSYKILNDKKLKDMITNSSSFLTEQLLEINKGDYYFKYHLFEDSDKIVPNASAQGLQCISHVLSIINEKELRNIGKKIVDFIIKNQKKDGSWAYSFTTDGKERSQLDFHQGYMIVGLLSFLPYANNRDRIIDAIKKGSKYYKDTLFFNNCQSYYRYPMKYPIDIHNQAQGIITFSKLSVIDPNYLKFAYTIAKWTINNMQDKSGFFYHQKWRLFTNKIPYMRWSQAWMMLALTDYLCYSKMKVYDEK